MTQTKEKKPDKVKSDITSAEAKEVSHSGAIVPMVQEGQIAIPVDFKSNFSRKQIEVIKEQFAKGASDMELQMFIYVCRMTKLDPFSKQIHLVPRWDSKLGKDVRVVVVGIDGLRSTAERTGAYAGNTDPVFGEETEITVIKKDWKTKKEVETKAMVPTKATVTVKKVVQGVICDFTATAKWTEYYPGDKSGMMWIKMPENMLGKCAEAKALRKAFPAVMSGLYIGEEMQQAVQGAVASATPEMSESYYEKAAGMIKGITDMVGLGELKDKIAGSKKYSATEKKKLVDLIEARIGELTPEKENAPATVS